MDKSDRWMDDENKTLDENIREKAKQGAWMTSPLEIWAAKAEKIRKERDAMQIRLDNEKTQWGLLKKERDILQKQMDVMFGKDQLLCTTINDIFGVSNGKEWVVHHTIRKALLEIQSET